MNFKHHLTAGAIVISLVAVSRFMGGYAVDEAQIKKHAAIIVTETKRVFGHSIGKSEEGCSVRPDGVWLAARLPAHEYGPDTYSDLDETMKLNGQSTLSDKRRAYYKNGAIATLGLAKNIGGKSNVVVVDSEFSSLSLSQYGESRDSNKLQ